MSGKLANVHNGISKKPQPVRKKTESSLGYRVTSETGHEVVAHLMPIITVRSHDLSRLPTALGELHGATLPGADHEDSQGPPLLRKRMGQPLVMCWRTAVRARYRLRPLALLARARSLPLSEEGDIARLTINTCENLGPPEQRALTAP